MTFSPRTRSTQVSFPSGCKVYDVADPDYRRKIIRAGAEVSEVRYDDGAERNVSDAHLRAAERNVSDAHLRAAEGPIETDNEELAKPTHPSTREDTTVRHGQEAWCRLRANSTWADWVAVGAAHVVGRSTAMRDAHTNTPKGRGYNAAFIAWQKKFGFETLDKGDRARLFEVMNHLKEIDDWLQKLPESERLRLKHPNSVLRRWKAAIVKPKASELRISPVQKLKDSLVNLQEENDRMRREIERGGGDLWSADDRPKDIARIIVDKLTKAKAERVARNLQRAEGSKQVMSDNQYDRATVVARSILQIVAQRIRDDCTLRAQLTDVLRDEFHDIARSVMNEIRQEDE
jgi:hypothetical protein